MSTKEFVVKLRAVAAIALSVFPVAVLLSLAIPFAQGAPLYQDGAGGRARGMGGTGTAVANDPLGALFNNPAAMSEIDRMSVSLGVDTGIVHGAFHNSANNDANMTNAGVIGEGAFVLPVGPVRLGIGINPDIVARTDWRYRDAPGGADGATTYGARRNVSELLLIRGALGASWEITPKFSIGASLGALYNENQLHTPYVFQTQPTLRGVKTLLDLDTDGFGFNGQFGARWRPVPSVALSATYTTRASIQSEGSASGNAGVQLTNIGLGAARHDFAYDAEVTNVFPQQVSAGIAWQASKQTVVSAQFDWINWSNAFDSLPVRLRRGNNADLNGLVGSRRLNDNIPLDWRDQYVGRFGIEQGIGEHWMLRGGYSYGNNPVPDATLLPLTAAITEHTVTAGIGYNAGPFSIDAAYQFQLPATARARQTRIVGGEYANSVTEIDVQWVSVTATWKFGKVAAPAPKTPVASKK